MLNKKGISMIALIITIIIIILIAAISVPLLSTVIDDSLEQDAKAELKNVEMVVADARAQMLIDDFTPNKNFVIKDEELDSKFGLALSEETRNAIKSINAGADPCLKYYLLNQSKFDQEFGNNFNIDGIRGEREYLVNYYYGIVLASYTGKDSKPIVLTNANESAVVPAEILERGDITVAISPNGNSEWRRIQVATVTFTWDSEINSLTQASSVWSESISQPGDASFTDTFSGVASGIPIARTLNSKTGNGWYLWIKIDYKEKKTGMDRTKYVRSDPFYLDNTKPSAELEVNEIN